MMTISSPASTVGEQYLLDNWLNIQSINLVRHSKSLRPFGKDEFGTTPAAPSEAHIEAVNRFIDRFRQKLIEMSRWVEGAVRSVRTRGQNPNNHRLSDLAPIV